jgi:SAM-dependent methyltransferase
MSTIPEASPKTTKTRPLKHHIAWRDAWQKMREERQLKPQVSYDSEFFNRAVEDFSQRIKANDYQYGRRATHLLSELVGHESDVLEIGPGPGTLTIPLARRVKRVVGVEVSSAQVDRLQENLKQANLSNVEVVNESWERVGDDAINDAFDLVVCSHFLWQVEDIEGLLDGMEKALRSFCAIIQPCGRDEVVKEVFEEIGNQAYTGQFEPDADYFAYVVLREWGRRVHTAYFSYTFERDLEQQIRYVAGLVGRFVEVNRAVEKRMRDYLLPRSHSGKYREENEAVVMWWKPEKE